MVTFLVGLQAGAQYALIAAAVVIVFSTTGVVNFAVGAYATFAVYLAIELDAQGLAPLLTVLLTCLIIALGSVLLDVALVSPLMARFPTNGANIVVIALIVVFVLSETIIQLVWGPNATSLPQSLTIHGDVRVGGTVVTNSDIVTFIATSVVIMLTYVLLYRTRVGIIIRGVAERGATVALLGLSPARYRSAMWGYAGVVSAIAGLLLANSITPSPTMSDNVLIKAIAGVALGGLTSLAGAVLGALFIGLLEAYTANYIDPGLATVVPIALIFLMLVFRPRGLLGRAEVQRV